MSVKSFAQLLTICALTAVFAPVSAEDQLPLATGEWPPHTSEQLPSYGIITEIVSAVVADMGITPKYGFYPWKRAEDLVLKGEVFGAFPYAQIPERTKSFDFSDDFFPSRDFKIFYSKRDFPDSPSWTNLSDLSSYRVGAVLGAWYVSELEAAGIRMERLASDQQVFQMLRAGRVDIAIAEERVGWWYISQLFPEETYLFDVFEKPFATKNNPGGLMISRDYPNSAELKDSFNRSLKRIKENGIYDSIISKYGVPGIGEKD